MNWSAAERTAKMGYDTQPMILREVKESKEVHGWVRINVPFVTL
jgi:hypothetical protein